MGLNFKKIEATRRLQELYKAAIMELRMYDINFSSGSPVGVYLQGCIWRVRKGPKDYGFVDDTTPVLLSFVDMLRREQSNAVAVIFKSPIELTPDCILSEYVGIKPYRLTAKTMSSGIQIGVEDVLSSMFPGQTGGFTKTFCELLWATGADPSSIESSAENHSCKCISDTSLQMELEITDEWGNKSILTIIY